MAQELTAHHLEPYFFKKAKMGELDFTVQYPFDSILPIEVKSGKGYTRRSALTNAMNTANYAIKDAIVFCEGNVETQGRIRYLPIYMTMFLQRGDSL